MPVDEMSKANFKKKIVCRWGKKDWTLIYHRSSSDRKELVFKPGRVLNIGVSSDVYMVYVAAYIQERILLQPLDSDPLPNKRKDILKFAVLKILNKFSAKLKSVDVLESKWEHISNLARSPIENKLSPDSHKSICREIFKMNDEYFYFGKHHTHSDSSHVQLYTVEFDIDNSLMKHVGEINRRIDELLDYVYPGVLAKRPSKATSRGVENDGNKRLNDTWNAFDFHSESHTECETLWYKTAQDVPLIELLQKAKYDFLLSGKLLHRSVQLLLDNKELFQVKLYQNQDFKFRFMLLGLPPDLFPLSGNPTSKCTSYARKTIQNELVTAKSQLDETIQGIIKLRTDLKEHNLPSSCIKIKLLNQFVNYGAVMTDYEKPSLRIAITPYLFDIVTIDCPTFLLLGKNKVSTKYGDDLNRMYKKSDELRRDKSDNIIYPKPPEVISDDALE